MTRIRNKELVPYSLLANKELKSNKELVPYSLFLIRE